MHVPCEILQLEPGLVYDPAQITAILPARAEAPTPPPYDWNAAAARNGNGNGRHYREDDGEFWLRKAPVAHSESSNLSLRYQLTLLSPVE